MLQKAFWAVVVAVFLATPLFVQGQEPYLDVYVVNVKPEKAAEFDMLAKKIVAANRKYDGDHWLAAETVYGEGYQTAFISTRQSYAELDKANDAFMAALNKAYGKDSEKMLQEWNTCLSGSRTELRRRRFDLSRKVPKTAADYAKLLADSRVLRTTVVHVKPGHIDDFEAMMKDAKAAGDNNPNTQPLLVSQVMEGSKGTTFYVTGVRTSMGGFDNNPTTKEILGDEGYAKWMQKAAEAIEGTESAVLRYDPELSNPPKEIIAAAPDYWTPKPAMAAAKPKAKGVETASKTQKQ